MEDGKKWKITPCRDLHLAWDLVQLSICVYSPFSLSAKPTQIIIDVLVCSGGHTGEGAGGGCAPSRTKYKAKNAYYSEVSQIGP